MSQACSSKPLPSGEFYSQECSLKPEERAAAIQSLCHALFDRISFVTCAWYETSLDHLTSLLQGPRVSLLDGRVTADQPMEKKLSCTVESIKKKISTLSSYHLSLLNTKVQTIDLSNSRQTIRSLYEAAGQKLAAEHPSYPCVCEVS